VAQQTYEYQAEMKRLLNLIVHSLYTHPEVFLRELISNASDALNKVRFSKASGASILDADTELAVRITIDEKNNTFAIEDSGIGMDKDELIKNLGTIARSGTREFLESAKDDKTVGENLIGQFGVGFYSTFMVTDRIKVTSRRMDTTSQGYVWESDGEGSFTIDATDKKTRGTEISFVLKEEHKDFAHVWRVKEIIKKYSNFADFPIYVNGEKVNTVSALWQRSPADVKPEELNEFFKFIGNEYKDPLDVLHFSTEGAVNFKALLFIPQDAPNTLSQFQDAKSVSLYANRVMIQDDCKELLPEYLRFFKGVVDTSDLPLNVSRETAQNSPVTAKIKQALINRTLKHLEKMATSDTDKFKTFYKNFGPLLKTGVSNDFSNRDKLIELLRFESTATAEGTFTTFKEYTLRMKSDQKEIYFLTGSDRASLLAHPNLEFFTKNGLEVLLLSEPVDAFVMPTIHEYDKKPIKSIESSDLEVMKDQIKVEESAMDKDLATLIKGALGDKVSDVKISKRLVDSPATLVRGEDAMDAQMERMMKMMNKDFSGSKRVLEINTKHPLIRNLAAKSLGDKNDPMIALCAAQLYESALLLEGSLVSPAEYVKRMVSLMEKATA
jgi:molecular chaperone HtpG